MGMFDNIRCDCKLPARAIAQTLVYQTKDIDCTCSNFHLRPDGTLWGETYDIEDHSDPEATGAVRLLGCMTRVNVQPVWRRDFSGTIEFYTDYGSCDARGWLAFKAVFDKGCLVGEITLLEDIVPADIAAEDEASALDLKTMQCDWDGRARRI